MKYLGLFDQFNCSCGVWSNCILTLPPTVFRSLSLMACSKKVMDSSMSPIVMMPLSFLTFATCDFIHCCTIERALAMFKYVFAIILSLAVPSDGVLVASNKFFLIVNDIVVAKVNPAALLYLFSNQTKNDDVVCIIYRTQTV